jgi:hypothetical protein
MNSLEKLPPNRPPSSADRSNPPIPADAAVPPGEFFQRLWKVVALTTVLYVPYVLSNHFPVFTPRELPLSALDAAIPFWTWTVVPYFLLIGGMYLPALVADRRIFTTAMLAILIGVVLNNLVFFLWPTTYPRPLAEPSDSLHAALYQFLIAVDTPGNCFPSAHITAPAIGCWALAQQFRRWRWLIYLIFIPFALSILTTKQHYTLDLIGGLATAGIGLLIAHKLTKRTSTGQPVATPDTFQSSSR